MNKQPSPQKLRLAIIDVTVSRGPTLDGLGHYLRDDTVEFEESPVDVAAALREAVCMSVVR